MDQYFGIFAKYRRFSFFLPPCMSLILVFSDHKLKSENEITVLNLLGFCQIKFWRENIVWLIQSPIGFFSINFRRRWTSKRTEERADLLAIDTRKHLKRTFLTNNNRSAQVSHYPRFSTVFSIQAVYLEKQTLMTTNRLARGFSICIAFIS